MAIQNDCKNIRRHYQSGETMRITISAQEFQDMTLGLGNPGVCTSCGMVDEFAGCEPDARNYECPECGKHTLMGLEEALMEDILNITED